MNWWQRFNRSSAHTQANIVCTIVLMIATLAYSIIAGLQLNAINRQLPAIQKSAKAATDAAYAACVASQISRAAFIKSIGTSKDAHDASVADTYQTMVATKSEAAHITLDAGPITFGIGVPVTTALSVKNDGKTAATRVVTTAIVKFVSGTDEIKQVYGPWSLRSETPYLEAGGQPLSLRQNPTLTLRDRNGIPEIPSAEDQNDLMNGRKFILVFARASYIDSLGINHWVDFCRTAPPATRPDKTIRAAVKCVRYNGEDHNSAVLQRPTEPDVPASIPEISCPVPKDQ